MVRQKRLVSDNGSIFKAKQAMKMYELLGIRKEFIKKRQPWMSYIETTFNIQRRMGDFHFKKARTWEDMRVEHDRWVADYNYQVHWAHRNREDNRHSPAEVLGWVKGKMWQTRAARSYFLLDALYPPLEPAWLSSDFVTGSSMANWDWRNGRPRLAFQGASHGGIWR